MPENYGVHQDGSRCWGVCYEGDCLWAGNEQYTTDDAEMDARGHLLLEHEAGR